MQPRMAGRGRPEQLLSLELELVVPVVAALLLCAAGDVRHTIIQPFHATAGFSPTQHTAVGAQ